MSQPRDHPSCTFTLPALPAAAKTTRARLGHWLERLHWPAEQRYDIEAAVSEAVSNVVEHAYGPDIDRSVATVAVDATLEPLPDGFKRIRVQVADDGRWRPFRDDPDNHHLGLTLIRGLMDHVMIHHSDAAAGTRVVMFSAPIPGQP